MYAVFEDGSHQYKVSVGQTVKVDWREAELGSRIEFNRVLLLADGTDVTIGQPTVEGTRVVAEVVDHPSIKLYIQHFRRRKNYRRLKGHRQHYVAVKVYALARAGEATPPVPEKKKKEEKPAETPAATAPATPPSA